ncbi:MAG: division plane positioning ATPase MipZ [Maricaulaceae bacterium]
MIRFPLGGRNKPPKVAPKATEKPQAAPRLAPRPPGAPPHVIVVGNEKGGAGKSTVAMHLTVALMRMDLRVGCVDLDLRQRTFTHYLENRKAWCARNGVALPMPSAPIVEASKARNLDEAEVEETARWSETLQALGDVADFIVVDSPGSDTFLSRRAHSYADTILTPVNDSFLDFDLLAVVDPITLKIGRPSVYSEMVWEARKIKAVRDKKPADWVVMRNRMSPLEARNKRRVGEGLSALAKRVGFRLAPGFSERVIYRELFPTGLTLLDLTEEGSTTAFTMSHVAARQEVRDLLIVLKLPGLEGAALRF